MLGTHRHEHTLTHTGEEKSGVKSVARKLPTEVLLTNTCSLTLVGETLSGSNEGKGLP